MLIKKNQVSIAGYFHHICNRNPLLQTETTYTEAELVAGLKAQRNEAYRYLYLHYRGAVYNIITQIISNSETANDVLQEVFVTVWKNIDKYDPAKGRLFTWLLKLTRNAAINQTRVKNYKVNHQNVSLDNSVNIGEESHSPNVNLIGLRAQVHQLREEYKNVVELSYFKGLTQEEISKALNVPIGTVKTRLRNAIIELRKQFV